MSKCPSRNIALLLDFVVYCDLSKFLFCLCLGKKCTGGKTILCFVFTNGYRKKNDCCFHKESKKLCESLTL